MYYDSPESDLFCLVKWEHYPGEMTERAIQNQPNLGGTILSPPFNTTHFNQANIMSDAYRDVVFGRGGRNILNPADLLRRVVDGLLEDGLLDVAPGEALL